jgi:hypothetical protein
MPRRKSSGCLSAPPSELAFRALCAALDRAGSPEELVERCEQGLADWPDETRKPPYAWLTALESGDCSPAWRPARSLPSDLDHIGMTEGPSPTPAAAPRSAG